MSHFTVLVIGADPEEQLVPFDENTRVDATLQGPVSEEEIADFVKHFHEKHKEANPSVPVPETSMEELYAQHGEDWNGNTWKKHEDGTWHEYSTYNPNSKWDWYQLGGRWTGFFKLKEKAEGVTGKPGIMTSPGEPGWVDQALKSAIDFEGMRNHEGLKDCERYEKAMILFGDLPANESWEQTLARTDRESASSVDRARQEYWKQPRCEAWQKQPGGAGFGSSPDDFLISKDDFIQKARDEAFSTYAILNKGAWIGKGEMGMFGMGHNEMPQSDWNKEVNKLIDGLPDNTLLSLYDCHI